MEQRTYDWAWGKAKLRPMEKFVLLCCVYLTVREGHTVPVLIRRHTGLSKRCVQRAITVLAEAGYLYWAPVVDGSALKEIAEQGDGIACQWCGIRFAFLDEHHLISPSKGGTDEKNNLVWLCPNCHRLAHRKVIMVNPLE